MQATIMQCAATRYGFLFLICFTLNLYSDRPNPVLPTFLFYLPIQINQILTDLGVLHVVFQPVFSCMMMMSMFRRFDPETRVQADLIFNMCVLAGCWFVFHDVMDNFREVSLVRPRATEDHPSYNWMGEGYDARLGMSTPNIPGESCTFK